MKKLVEQFEHYLAQQSMSGNTVKSYLTSVNTYFNIYGHKISATNVAGYQNYLEQHYRPKTINLRVIGFNRFLSFAGFNQQKLHPVKYQQKSFLDNVISYSDYLKFKSQLHQEPDQKWYFVVWTLAATGVRISELMQFKAEHIYDGQLDIRSKGNKIRRVYIPKNLQIRLIEWLDAQRRVSGPLFLNGDGEAISIRGITKGLERLARKHGIDRHLVHPHAFRHLFAKKFLESKNDLSMLADLLGHESLDTTKIYLRMTSQEQHDIIDQIVEW